MIAVIEIPKGSIYKYETRRYVYGVDYMTLFIDRVLNQPIPSNYGFIKNMPLAEDGDAPDIFILSKDPIPPLTEVEVEVHGVFICFDNGVSDNKVIATIKGDEIYQAPGLNFPISEVENYLRTYKNDFIIQRFHKGYL